MADHDEDRVWELVESQRLIEKLFQGLPIKWVVYICNSCIRGVDFQGSNKKSCILALSKWHIIGSYGISHTPDSGTVQTRWVTIREEVVVAHRSYATWLRHRSENFDQRAERIHQVLLKEGAKESSNPG